MIRSLEERSELFDEFPVALVCFIVFIKLASFIRAELSIAFTWLNLLLVLELRHLLSLATPIKVVEPSLFRVLGRLRLCVESAFISATFPATCDLLVPFGLNPVDRNGLTQVVYKVLVTLLVIFVHDVLHA